MASHILPEYRVGIKTAYLAEDLASLASSVAPMALRGESEFGGDGDFWREVARSIPVGTATSIELGSEDTEINPAFYAAARNLIFAARQWQDDDLTKSISRPYFLPSRIVTSSPTALLHIERQLERAGAVARSNASQFAKSAYYMGSKRVLAPFLVEALSSALCSDGAVVDLMCGSGAASGGFSRFWRTIASDAQRFCRVLAVVQGGGFSVREAQSLLRQAVPAALDHAAELRARIAELVDEEDRILHSDPSHELWEEYAAFARTLPTYPDGRSYGDWNPTHEVEQRKTHLRLRPYCLFTGYFANVFFGLRQCIEIDSLRFALDQRCTDKERRWGLGALVATLSALGTTYAAHFAQPVVAVPGQRVANGLQLVLPDAMSDHGPGKQPEGPRLSRLVEILETRAHSVLHDFSVRLLNLAEESERAPRAVEAVPGPWQAALPAAACLLGAQRAVVYVDAPYTREEYSRYYHVLETLVSYSYPSCVGKGKIPDKRKGERFVSEFFTRSSERLTEALASVILGVVRRGWTCAWSYSDAGAADIIAVIDRVTQAIDCSVRSYAAPHEYKAQGKKGAKEVTEYLVLLTPR